MNKKGYYFLIDALVGSMIIFSTMALVLNAAKPVAKSQFNYEIVEDYGTLILNTKMEDLENDVVDQLVQNGLISNMKNTIIEQVDQFYYNAKYICIANSACDMANLSNATNLIQSITNPIISTKYGFSYRIIDSTKNINVTIYNRSMDTLNATNMVIASKKVTFLKINSSAMFGPEIVEIRLWT